MRNLSFEDSDKPENWDFTPAQNGKSQASIDSSRPLNAFNKRSLRIDSDGGFTLENPGYYGMGIAAGESYTFRAAFAAKISPVGSQSRSWQRTGKRSPPLRSKVERDMELPKRGTRRERG